MPKIVKSAPNSRHLNQIERVANSILTGHNRLVWSQRTRDDDISNS
jgi:hypothetical protein